MAFDPRTAIPSKWSLKPEDTFGLIFWTRNPRNLIDHADRLKDYPLVVHFTLTAWHEVEHGAPGLKEGFRLMAEAVNKFGPERVVWRFSPVPLVEDVVDRYRWIARHAREMGLRQVYVSFLQENDRIPERRPRRVRLELLRQMATLEPDLKVLLCNDDQTTLKANDCVPANLRRRVCEDGMRFGSRPPFEGCGCSLALDPFTINESCSMGCSFCYAADQSLNPVKRNTTGGGE